MGRIYSVIPRRGDENLRAFFGGRTFTPGPPMRALVAFDKFKDALTAGAASAAAAAALHSRHPDWQLDLCPLTDGGEGFCEVLCQHVGGSVEQLTVRGPRGGTVTAPAGFISSHTLTAAARQRLCLGAAQKLAVIGLASASGLEL